MQLRANRKQPPPPPPPPPPQRPSSSHRPRKKRKRLDSIRDDPQRYHPIVAEGPDTPGSVRRSSRPRRAPVILDASPTPSRKRRRGAGRVGRPPNEGNKRETRRGRPKRVLFGGDVDGGREGWTSRLRSRVKGFGYGSDGDQKGEHLEMEEVMSGNSESMGDESGEEPSESEDQTLQQWLSPSKSGADGGVVQVVEEEKVEVGVVEEQMPNEDLESKSEHVEEEQKMPGVLESENHDIEEEQRPMEDVDGKSGPDDLVLPSEFGNDEAKEEEEPNPTLKDEVERPRGREGRRCGLCGGGTDGKPPKRLVRDFNDSNDEGYDGSSASEEPNYDVLDGFGDEPGWLGRLLGPILDRFGIARVWVHQHCAVWSPEVYFAGLGCLKNVRAALCRGRVLKCSRCSRPGATIGCRVDRCPKTYHLPCARAEGCTFDHRKFLIVCTDHRHLFQPQGSLYLQRLKKLKVKKMRLDIRKTSADASRKDLEAEEKWLENCGEDEEFLKREGKRLHRDILRISPVYIGGSSGNENLYEGWESVAGLQDVVQCMKEVVILPLLYPEFYSSMGITPPRGVLLHGYPGTGKTLVVRALIGACSRGDKKIAYFARKGADCLGKYVGDAERQLRLLFHVAEKSQPAIIFFDEIDGLAPCRSRQQDQTHCSVVSTLLALLDGVKSRGSVIVIGATNRPDAVDPALRRPGRFDREIYFPLPSVMDRSAILSLHTRSWPKPISEPVLSWVAKQTVGFAGADLQALCTQAAIIALKRNCSLKGLMSSAEKSFIHGKRTLLPSIVVEETDWLAALSCVPPPCSRREAGMAANDVFSSPLHPHLIPCLLQPLLHLLISLSLEECVWLPPTLYKGSKLMKDIIFSALENKRISVALWCSHLHNLIQEPDVTKEIEKGLYRAGLLDGLSDYYLDQSDGEGKNDDWKSVLFQLNSSGARMFSKSLLCFLNPLGKKTGFRVLITGSPRSGQHHLASCFLHGFVGHIEIRKIDLATISQEGHGDIIRGVTHILLQCLSLGRCIIYLPRIDLWALEEICQQPSDEENDIYPKKISDIFETPCPQIVTKNMSQAWKSFVEQVDSVCTPPSFIIVATCEVPNHDLPLGIRGFFNDRMVNGICTHPASSAQTVPQYALQVDGKLNHDVMVDASAIKLSQDLIQKFVHLIHHKTHMAVECETTNCDSANDILEVQRDHVEGKVIESVDEPVDSERITSNGGASCSNKGYQQYLDGDKSLPSICKIFNHHDQEVQMHHHHGACVRTNNKILKGKSNIMLAIATFGYQILCYPHFAELCWSTSGLKEGPSADIHGPWKGWPFNSCIVRPPSSSDKVAMGSYPGNEKNKENFSIVRGLIAVGLLAYRGLYSSVLEVTREVRNVLELLLGEINSKILGGKDKYRFIRLLSQVAYLEDMVNSWAYSFQRLQLDNQMPASIVRPMPGVTMNTQDHESNTNLDTCLPHVSNKSSQEENSTCINSSKDLPDNGLPSSDMIDAVPRPSQDKLLLTTDTDSCQNSFSVFSSVAHGDTLNEPKKTGGCEPCESENHEPCELVYQRSQTVKQHNGSAKADGVSHSEEGMGIMDDCISRKDRRQCNGLSRTGTVLSSDVGGCIHAETVRDDVSNIRENNNVLAMPACICVYECCSGCCNAIHTLIRKVLSDSLASYGYLTIDDVHDVVASCSVSLSAKIQKYFFTQNSSCDDHSGNQQQNGIDAKLCACQDVGNQLNKMPHQCGNVKNMENLPAKCGNHRIGQYPASTDVHKSSPLGPGLKFFFRDGTLVPSHSINNIVLHCKIENLCICALTERITKNQKDFSLML